MPRKTPVRELQKEEPTVGSPLRRSSRLNNSSPVPTKVITRRNSASETSASTPTVTRGRRSSFSQEIQPSEGDKKKTTIAIKTRRSSLTQNKDDQAQVEPTVKTRARSASKEPEQIPEVKKTTGRRRSITEDLENDQDATKKVSRTRNSSMTKKNEVSEVKSTKKQNISATDVSASTPIKKSPSQNNSDILESIEETNKEVESPSGTPSKKLRRRITEVSKIDFDLSVINEASLTEEEISPHKKSTIMDKVEDESEKTNIQENVLETEKDKEASDGIDVDETAKKSTENEPELDSAVAEKSLSNKKSGATEKHESSISDTSFNLQLSPLENTSQNKPNANNKENISPKGSSCEPMEVDEVFPQSSPAKKKLQKSPRVAAKVEVNEVEKKLQAAAKITDKMAEILTEEILLNKNENTQDELVLAATTTDEDRLDENNLNLEKANLKEVTNSVLEISKQVEENQGTTIEEKGVEKSEKVAQKVPSAEISKTLTPTANKVEGIDTITEARLVENIATESELNKSGEVNIEEQNTSKSTVQSSLIGDTKNKITGKVAEESVKSTQISTINKSDVTDSTPQTIINTKHNLAKNASAEKSPRKTPSEDLSNGRKSDVTDSTPERIISTDHNLAKNVSNVKSPRKTPSKDLSNNRKSDSFHNKSDVTDSTPQTIISTDHNLSKNVSDEKSPRKTPSKDISSKRKSDSFHEQTVSEESVTSRDSVSEKEASPVKENRSFHLNTEEEMEVDANEKSCLEKEVINVGESSDDTDQTATLNKKEDFAISGQKESNVSQELKREEVVTVSESSNEDDLDLEVKSINESKNEKGGSDEENSVNLCDSDSSEGNEDNDESDVKKSERCYSVSDDEIVVSKKKSNKRSIDKLERSIDSKYMINMREKAQSAEKIQSDSNSELVELSDEEDQENEVFDEPPVNSTLQNDDDETTDINQTINAESVGKGKEKKVNRDSLNVSTNSLRKRSSDRKSITLQETIKAGDPEQKLSGHIHKVVDLFCATLKNKSDLSINVSMEYAEHVSDSEDENGKEDIINISLTACDINEVEPEKGIKRRKLCHASSDDLKSPQKICSNKDEDQDLDETFNEMSQDSSIVSDEEKITSAKKPKKRKSDAVHQAENSPVRTPLKVSFSTDTEDKNKSAKKTKRKPVGDVSVSEKELTDQKEQEISPVKKTVPLTPFKVNKTQQSEESSYSAEESSDSDEENNASIIRIYDNLFSESFEETDANDVSWKPDEEVDSDESESEEDDSNVDEEEEETLQNESFTIETKKERRKTNSRSSSEERPHISEKSTKTPQSGSSSSDEDVVSVSVKETEENINKNKKRKLFRLSRFHNLSQAFASSETEENANLEQAISTDKVKKHSKDSTVDQNKSKAKNKKLKQTFSSETVECMLPQMSEVQEKTVKMSRKRRHTNSSNLDDEEHVKNTQDLAPKKRVKEMKKKTVLPIIKPSRSNKKNLKPLRMKPSTKMVSGWSVTTM